MLGWLCHLVPCAKNATTTAEASHDDEHEFSASGAMIDVEGVSKSFGETEAFVSVKLEGPGGHRAGVARPGRSWQGHACRSSQSWRLRRSTACRAGCWASPESSPSPEPPTPCERSPKAAPSTPNLFWTVRWSIAIPAVFAPWQSVATGRASTQRHPLPPKPREQMP